MAAYKLCLDSEVGETLLMLRTGVTSFLLDTSEGSNSPFNQSFSQDQKPHFRFLLSPLSHGIFYKGDSPQLCGPDSRTPTDSHSEESKNIPVWQ